MSSFDVPEPATRALMILEFGAVGDAMRGNPRSTAGTDAGALEDTNLESQDPSPRPPERKIFTV